MGDEAYWFNDEQEIRDQCWHIQPGDVVIDVGCHIGSYSIPALNAGAVVYAVDPDESRLAELRRLWDGDQSRLITVCEALAEPGGYTPEFRDALDVADFTDFHAPADALFSTLDELVTRYNLTRVDWVKIDVEGAELGVLLGGVGLLAGLHPKLLIEAHDKVYKFVADMDNERRCHDLLTGFGYDIEVVPYYDHAWTVDRDFWFCVNTKRGA